MITDQEFGGSFNAHKHWKKLRKKHRKNSDGMGGNGRKGKFVPEEYIPYNSAGKGDTQRSSNTPIEIYNLNYDLAFGRITKEEHTKKIEEFWENQ